MSRKKHAGEQGDNETVVTPGGPRPKKLVQHVKQGETVYVDNEDQGTVIRSKPTKSERRNKCPKN
jgi:hypothetical protein